MPRFGIVSPLLGLKLDCPTVLIESAFTPDNNAVRVVDSKVVRARGRLAELLDADGNPIAAPESVYEITAIAAHVITVDGDHADEFAEGDEIRINGSTDNDALWTAVSAAFDTDHTDVTVEEELDTDTADGNVFVGRERVLRYHLLRHSAGFDYLFVFTAAHVFLWAYTTKSLSLLWTVDGGCQAWDAATFNDRLYAVNGADKPLEWGVGDDALAEMEYAGCPTAARFVTAYENRLILGGTTETVGGLCARRIRWCDLGDASKWDSGDAGAADVGGEDGISGGFGRSGDTLIVLKERSVERVWAVTTEEVFNAATLPGSVGCAAPGSVVNDAEGRLYYFGTDSKIREISAGEISGRVDAVVRDVSPDALGEISAAFIPEYNEVWFALPVGSTQNTRTLRYRGGMWQVTEGAHARFGAYRRQESWTIDTLPYATIDEWDWPSINSPEGLAGSPVDLVADYNGYTYAAHNCGTDAGSEMEPRFTLANDLAGGAAMRTYKRLHRIETYWRPTRTSYEVVVEARLDGEVNWRSVATLSVGGEGRWAAISTPVSLRAKFFEVRFRPNGAFEFLGAFFDFEYWGER